MKQEPRIAIVCDWLTNLGGGEKVVLDMHKAFPNAPIYTSLFNEEKLPEFKNADIRTSFIQKIPFAKKKHQLFLGLMPYAFESFDLSDYDIVLSSCFACSKGVITKVETQHICYCHNPMRYVWDDSHQYLKDYNISKIIKFFAKPILHKIRIWDRVAADRVDTYIANSEFVKKRIKKYYKAESEVINPGITLEASLKDVRKIKGDYYLAIGRLENYKKFDLIVETFNKLQKPLIIIGRGKAKEQLEKMNTSPNTKFLGFVSYEVLKEHFLNAKGMIFPQCEDFGITQIEAQYFGCPVIAYKKGGALETIIDNKTGIFFEKQNAQSLAKAIEKAENTKFDYSKIHLHAKQFESAKFQEKLKDFVTKAYSNYRSQTNPEK